MGYKINKSTLVLYFIMTMLLFGFQFGVFLSPALKGALFTALSSIGFYYFFTHYKIYPKVVRSWVIVFLAMMCVSMIMANLIIHQSLASCFVANNDTYNIGTILLIYYLLRRYKISEKRFYKAFFNVMWFTFFVYLLMLLSHFNYVRPSAPSGYNIKTASMEYVNFTALLLFAHYLYTSKYKYLVLCLLFFSINHWGDIQRGISLVQIGILLVGLLINQNKASIFKFILPSFFVAILGIIFLTSTNSGNKIVTKYGQAFLTLGSDGNSSSLNDYSALARIKEVKYAMGKFYQNPLLGNGNFRSSDKLTLKIPDYFYVSDIGVFGILYVFGAMGILVYVIQFAVIYKWIRQKIRFRQNLNYYGLGVLLTLLFLLIFSLQTGKSIMQPDLFLLYVMLYTLSVTENKKVNQVVDKK